MLLKNFSKKLLPCFILASTLILSISLNANASTETKPVTKKTMSNETENKSKPVHSLFTYVKSLDELQKKLQDAKNQKKPVMIEFFADWCPACRGIDAQVLSRSPIQKLMQPFVKLRVDLTNKAPNLMQIANHYQVYGTPTFIFYDKNGNQFNADQFRSVDDFKDVLIKLGR